MKAILSLVIVLGSINSFASAEMRSNRMMKAYQEEARKKARAEFCANHADYCQVEAKLKSLGEERNKIAKDLLVVRKADSQICNNTSVRSSQRMSLDGQGVKYVNYTPCESIHEYTSNKNLPAIKAKQAQLGNQLKAKDSEIRAAQAELNQLKQEIENNK